MLESIVFSDVILNQIKSDGTSLSFLFENLIFIVFVVFYITLWFPYVLSPQQVLYFFNLKTKPAQTSLGAVDRALGALKVNQIVPLFTVPTQLLPPKALPSPHILCLTSHRSSPGLLCLSLTPLHT